MNWLENSVWTSLTAFAQLVTWPTPSPPCYLRPPAGSRAPFGTSTAASWPDPT